MMLILLVYACLIYAFGGITFLIYKAHMQPTVYDLEKMMGKRSDFDKLIEVVAASFKKNHLDNEARKFWITDRFLKDLRNEKNRK